jgi:CheY-like chemotaxis protein
MRTPLNAIIGLSKLIFEAKESDEENNLKLEKIYDAGTTLLNTVNDILDISKIEADKFELIPIEYDVSSMINDTITQTIMFIEEKPSKFDLDIKENMPSRLYGDELRVKQILNNLLSNAFKYTKEGSVELKLEHERENNTVWISACIKDTGIGISPERLDKIFEDYSREDVKENRGIMGTGLGLSIVKKLIDLMGGSINVESEYGKGSAFSVRLPQKYVSDEVIGSEVVKNLKGFQFTAKRFREDSMHARISLPYARVLIVDDVVTNLDVARGLMKLYSIQTDCVTSGQQAIDAIRNEAVRYNAVFMDHMMPGMNGVETTQIIRGLDTDYARNIPIIALTADAIIGNEEMFLSKGFQAFISKPIELARLDSVLKKWVQDKDWEIPGLDMKKGVEQFDGDMDAYLKILRSYAKNTRQQIEMIKEVSRDNLKDYMIIVHGIKGSSWVISANAVGEQASALENAAKAGDYEFITANNNALLESVLKLVTDIEELLVRKETGKIKPKKSKPDEELLAKLLDACRIYSMDEASEAIEKLEGNLYESGGEFVDWLGTNVRITNFEGIIEKLSARAERMEMNV